VSSLHQTTPSLLTLDVENGIGIIKYVLNAQRDGHSTVTKNVSQSMIIVIHGTPPVNVFHVSLDLF